MSRFVFYFFVSLGVLFLFGLWFFLHPNSPWHLRNYYKIAFEEIGNLRAGDFVNVNGILKGYVKDFALTDSCVWTEIAVLAEVKIPVDSKLHIANSGLMGERVIEITLGESENYYANGERIMGYFDMGSTTIGNLVLDILDEANCIVDILADVADTLLSEDRVNDYKRLGQKAKQLGNKASRLVNTSERSVIASVDSLVVAKDKVTEIINSMKPDLDGMVKNADNLQENFAILKKYLENIKNNVNSIAEKLENGDNTISLALNKEQDGDLRRQMKKISEDAEKLMEKIRKDGLDLNVDIF